MWELIASAGSKLLGGVMDYFQGEKNREQQKELAEQNMALQRQFAQEGIRWKVNDAKAAGIHPLYALGANTTSFSPVSIGSLPEGNWSDTLGSMGQDISRSINATRTQGEREDAFTVSAKKLDLEGKQLDNDIKRAQLASSVQRIKQQANPPMPGQLPLKKPEDATSLYMGNGPIKTDTSISDAQEYENRYGEMSDWVFGPMVAWHDYVKNHGNPIPEWFGKHIRPGSFADKFYMAGRKRNSFNTRFGNWRY